MDGLLPLAMLTLLATVSISCPLFAASRLVRRVVRPAHHPETDVKPEPPLYMFLLRALLSIVAPTRVDHRSLAALHDQIGPGLTNPKSSHYENALTEVDASNIDAENADLPPPDTQERAHTDATPAFLSSSARIPNPCQRRILQDSRAFVDFTIGWDDIWPDLPSSPRVTYTYNSYFNAFTASRVTADPSSARSNPHSHGGGTPAPVHDDDESSEDEEMDYALLELASQSADEDLIWALQSLSLSDPPSPPSSSSPPPPPPLPAAGVSPFCPPPVPRAAPSPGPGTPQTWRLEWY